MFICLSPGGQSITQGETPKEKLLVGTVDGITGKRSRETRRHSVIVAPIFLNPLVTYTPLHETKAVAAQLAPERIDINDAQQTFFEPDPRNPFGVIARTIRT